jgi:hypothetical protein
MPNTPNYGWTTPTEFGDVDLWGGILNTAFDDADGQVKIAEDKADAAQTTADGKLAAIVEDTAPQLGGFLEANGFGSGWQKGADIASVGTPTIPDTGNFFDITGTTAISSFVIAAHRIFALQFDASTQLEHSASLVLPGAANITTQAGDAAMFLTVAANTCICLVYTRADGTPVRGGSIGKHLIPLPYSVWRNPPSSAVEGYESELTNQVVWGWSFPPSVVSYVDFAFAAPKSSDETAGFTFRVRWTTITSELTDVVWEMKMAAVGNNDSVDAAWGTIEGVTDTVLAANDHMVSGESAAVVPGGTWAEHDTIKVRLTRKGDSGGDTHTGAAIMEHVDLFITTNEGTDD